MTATPTNRRSTASRAAARNVQEQPVAGQRLSCGSLWETSNAAFMAGNLRPSSGQYVNQQALLDILPEAPEGMAWRLKAYANRSTSEAAPTWDVCLELEAVYQR